MLLYVGEAQDAELWVSQHPFANSCITHKKHHQMIQVTDSCLGRQVSYHVS